MRTRSESLGAPRWNPELRTMLGARADAYAFDVSSSNSANSGTRTAGIVSPQASIAYSPTTSTELYVSGGFGFHSNDARGTTITHRPVFAFVRFDRLF